MAKGDVARELKNIHSTMTAMQSDIGSIKADIGDMKSDIGGLKYEVIAGCNRVDTALDVAKIRDEELLERTNVGFESVVALHESTDARFETLITEMRGNTDLLKSALVQVRRRVDRVEARKPGRRRS